jgi:hypothetical protein
VPGARVFPFFTGFAASSSADEVMASMMRSFHCDARIVEVASFVAMRNAKDLSKEGWFKILEYRKPPRRGSFSASS